MTKKTIKIQITDGVDSRPVAVLVQVASQYESQIFVESSGKRVNAKSIMGMMSLVLKSGEEVTVTADGPDEDTCLARLEEDVMIGVNNFSGEAGGYLGFEVDFHYANKTTTGTMAKVDGETITFTPDSAA